MLEGQRESYHWRARMYFAFVITRKVVAKTNQPSGWPVRVTFWMGGRPPFYLAPQMTADNRAFAMNILSLTFCQRSSCRWKVLGPWDRS